MPKDERTLAQLAEEALQVQDACNLSGVVNGWGRSIARLRAVLEDQEQYGTDLINEHPINKLWADKVSHLTGTQSSERDAVIGGAYEEVRRLSLG